jgi:hypothetical protein
MNRQKVYDADGKVVDSFTKAQRKEIFMHQGFGANWRVRTLNDAGFYIKGQTTSKGVKIK